MELFSALNSKWWGIQSTFLYFSASLGGSIILSTVQRMWKFDIFYLHSPSKPLQKYLHPGNKPTYALITGGNGGIGYGVALSLVQHGFGVILLGRNGDKLAAAATILREAATLSSAHDAARGTVTSPADRDRYVKLIVLDPQTATPDEIAHVISGGHCRAQPEHFHPGKQHWVRPNRTPTIS